MTTPDLKVDDRTVLFRRLEAILRDYAPLHCIKTWQTGRGNQSEDIAEPSSGLLPMVRMRPTSMQMQQTGINLRHHEFGVYIELITPGSDYDLFLNLWGEVENALVLDRALSPKLNGRTVWQFLQCGVDGETPRAVGRTTLYVQQDAVFGMSVKGQYLGRYGSGLVMIPFLKQS